MVPWLHNDIDAWRRWHDNARSGYEGGCLYKQKRTSWNFEGFLGFCMRLKFLFGKEVINIDEAWHCRSEFKYRSLNNIHGDFIPDWKDLKKLYLVRVVYEIRRPPKCHSRENRSTQILFITKPGLFFSFLELYQRRTHTLTMRALMEGGTFSRCSNVGGKNGRIVEAKGVFPRFDKL